MKRKYLEICFRLLRDDVLNLLSEKERKEFYKVYPLLEFMESEEKTDETLISIRASIWDIEYWIRVTIDFLAKSSLSPPHKGNWYKDNLEKCKWL